MDYITSHLRYNLGSLVKLKIIYQHFREKTAVHVKYHVFRETLTLLLKQINEKVLDKTTGIIRKDRTYYLKNMDFVHNVQQEEAQFVQLARHFYNLPAYDQELEIIER